MEQVIREKEKSLNPQPLFQAVIRATYKENLAYRSRMAISIISQPLYFLVNYFIWQAVFKVHDTVSGFTLDQMLYYFGVSSLLGYLNWDAADGTLQRLIQTGNFITFQLRPVSHLMYSFFQKVGHRALAFWVEVIPIMCFYLAFGIYPIPKLPLWGILSVALSFILSFLVNYCIGTLAFWLVRTDGIRRTIGVFTGLCSGMLLPLTMFPGVIQKILFFLPFQFIAYVPTRVFMGGYELAGVTMSIPQIVGLQGLMVLLMLLLYRVLWHFGIRRFTGVGS